MTLSTRALKVLSGVGAVAVCSVCGVLVGTDPKPAGAPLRPPVSDASSTSAALVIPPSCGADGVAAGSTATRLDPSLLPVIQQLRQATTAAERRTILVSLSASQRLEVEAYVRALRRTAPAPNGGCGNSVSAGGASARPDGSIAPSVVDAPPSTSPLINTYVS
jgi:hypothetical protein